MIWLAYALVIFLTALVTMLGTTWLIGRRERIPVARLADPRPLPGELPRAGLFDLPGTLAPFYGASQTGQPAPIPWDLIGASYELGRQRASQDEVSREVDAIIAEVEADPKWRRC